ncbi:MAG: hypothetical protein ACTSRK_00765 [Promethearchaeota archaeon]
MGRSKKKKEKVFTRLEYKSTLEKFRKGLNFITTYEEFEKLKQGIIKLYDVVKKNSALLELEPLRIEILKTCNLNIRFLNLDEDVWQLFSSGKIEEAYELVINGYATMNSHPDRNLLHDWVRNTLHTSLEKIANIEGTKKDSAKDKTQFSEIEPADSIMQIQSFPNESPMIGDNPLKRRGTTPFPSANTTLPRTIEDAPTIFPKNIAKATLKPHKKTEKTRILSTNDKFETMFNPQISQDFPRTETIIDPFERTDNEETKSNPINTFWVRHQNLKQNITTDEDILKKKKKKENSE